MLQEIPQHWTVEPFFSGDSDSPEQLSVSLLLTQTLEIFSRQTFGSKPPRVVIATGFGKPIYMLGPVDGATSFD